MNAEPGLVYIILVNWNGWEDTRECLESLHALDYPAHRIVVVDNGSSDDSVMHLRGLGDEIELIESEENLGFAGGNNLAIEHAMKRGAEYVWLLNNDTIVDPGALSALVDTAESAHDVGAVGSKVYYYDRPDVLWFAGGERHACGWAYHVGLDEVDRGQHDLARDCFFVSGCSMLVRTRAIEVAGRMTEDYFLYWEDVDWVARLREHGWRCVYSPESRLWHKVRASSSSDDHTWARYEGRNRVLFYRRHNSRGLPKIIVCTGAAAVWVALKGRPRQGWGYVAGMLGAFWGATGRIPFR